MILCIHATPLKQINPYMLFLIKAINMHWNDTFIIPMVFFYAQIHFHSPKENSPFCCIGRKTAKKLIPLGCSTLRYL